MNGITKSGSRRNMLRSRVAPSKPSMGRGSFAAESVPLGDLDAGRDRRFLIPGIRA